MHFSFGGFSMVGAMSSTDYVSFLERLVIDLCALGGLCALVTLRRGPRRGLLMVIATFNVGLFIVLTVISQRHIGPAIGFGLFAMLSIVRLRSEPFSNRDLAYFFSALVLALANGLEIGHAWFPAALDVLLLGALYLVDHPALFEATERRRVTLDEAIADPELLRAVLTERLGTDVVEATIQEIDYVRETTVVEVRQRVPSSTPSSVAGVAG